MPDATPDKRHDAATAAKATKVQRVDDNTYVVDLSPAFNIGAVPNGGYVAGHFLAVALAHVAERHGHRHVIAAHWDFLGRSRPGRGTMAVDELKVARNMSVLRIALYQDDSELWVARRRPVIVASVTCRDTATETGPSLDGGCAPRSPVPAADLALLPLGRDPGWARYEARNFRRNRHWHMYEPRSSAGGPAGVRDTWVEYQSGERITNLDLPYLADVTPAICAHGLQQAAAGGADVPASWYPTLNIHMDFKKSLPADGVRWLRLRTSVRAARNGRYGCDVDVFDADGDLVAQARHVAMIVDMSRNTANQTTSKLTNL
ncbi:hypothetical protein ISF_02697 [Cordyceps fumosorosea ARSEF 2679]|uniref:Thioesterase family protein n=1 Tax=Cordyceps fumosorosea (strain ARSEF 2679) TaxID=1081104 RepID=A0A168BYV6_CORFA|nr:hypothetical protein ISF_02697 [Cordyceps fumosorosea ARSEF 2679]OAA70723.1 hypothetical protein ISF_02697 [Cordyceps fumosorosea ARSEF 2679]